EAPIRLDKRIDLTIRPQGTHKPVLTLGDTLEVDAALFRIQDAKVKLEDLEFLVKPGRDRFKTQTVAAVVGDGHCTFQNCTVTLDRNKQSATLAVVTLFEPGGLMKADSTPALPPQVTFLNCFVRGEGDLVADRVPRAFKLKAVNALVALTGSFLSLLPEGSRETGTPPETAVPPTSQAEVVLELDHVTTYLTGHLVH